ncbi:MAG: NAD-dependent epimerase/dehydratase family protein, partial [Chloroflexi bacterium]
MSTFPAPRHRERCLVTGVAGFIGSHLAERLLDAGQEVVGVDRFTDFYPRRVKEQNLARLKGQDGFTLREDDLLTADLAALLSGVTYVFHLAGQPGVRGSWGSSFPLYADNNIVATQRLLEAARVASLKKFVFASSSSVYGDAPALPTRETTLPQPVSPYGVTKLAAEHLCSLYGRNFGVPTVSLRYFTVYGPRQRPDMAFYQFITAVLDGRELAVNGDGEQTRDFTYVADIVAATLAAAGQEEPAADRVYNIGGGARVSVNQVIALLERITKKSARIVRRPAQPGDAHDTFADCARARSALRFSPSFDLER